jgi:hypothetical protein
MSATAAIRATAVLLVLALAGCADPYTHDRTSPRAPTRTVAAPGSDVEQPAPPAKPLPQPLPSERPTTSARAAARSFAWRWVNWDWQTAARQQRLLARRATGELARQLRGNAASARIDATLARDKPGSHGSVVAVQFKVRGGRASGIVVTREQTLTDAHPNLGGRRYRVYLVRLTRHRNGWEVSAWTPQP